MRHSTPPGPMLTLVSACLALLPCAGLPAQAVVLSEYLAANGGDLEDEDGDRSDWIEIQNLGASGVDLDGWSLTDDAADLAKWHFPARQLASGEILVVFASGKNRTDAAGELHTSFSLSAEGEYLALVNPQGQVVDDYPAPFRPQVEDVSFGVAQTATDRMLVAEDAPLALQVPPGGAAGLDWTLPGHDDASWTRGTAPVGYDRDGGEIVPPGGERNLALAGTATQSSTGYGGVAARAIDGNTDPTYGGGSITHTNGEPGGWWEVDLGGSYFLRRVVLWNRIDCCSHRLTNFRLSILDAARGVVAQSDHFTDRSFPATQTYEILLAGGTRGRFVRIAKLGPDQNNEHWLSLAEVQIFEGGLPGFTPLLETNVEAPMLGVTASLYLRYPFALAAGDLAGLQFLTLRSRYDDGFVAYLNGTPIASRNAPAAPVADSTATAERADADAVVYEDINVSAARGALRAGANVLAVHALNVAPGNGDLFFSAELVARQVAGSTRLHFPQPTPGAANDTPGVAGFVGEIAVSHDRGYYDAPIQVAIGTPTAGAEIRYTLDGSAPSRTRGTVYAGPVRIDKTTLLRAAAFKTGLEPARVRTFTYVFRTDVIASTVMNRSITTDPRYAPEMRNALTDLPAISLVTPQTINGTTEVPVSVELLEPDGTAGFQVDAGVVHYGGAFTDFAKKNFRLYFRREYGPAKLKYPLFRGHDRVRPAVEVYDQLELRGGSHDMNERGFYMSNIFTDDTMLEMGNLNPHGRFVHLYLNGTYWGAYHLRERWNASMLAEYLGDRKESYEAINGNWNVGGWPDPGVPYDGDGSAWTRIKSLRDDYQGVKPYLDVQSYVDFMLMFMFGNSEDEYRCVGPTTAGSGFKFLLNDADGFTRDGGNRTAMGQPGRESGDGPGSIFSMLLAEGDPEYLTFLGDRIHQHFFNGGAMTPARNSARLLERCNQVARAFYAESARWGYRTPSSWASARDSYINGVLPGRTATVLGQYRTAGFYPTVEAPRFNRHGGIVAAGFTVAMTAPRGTIHYTVDGSDPRLPGGAIAPTAQPAPRTGDPPGPNLLERSTRVRARSLSAAQWSALTEAIFLIDTESLRVSELMYHPPRDAADTFDREEYEFIELQNIGTRPLRLLGLRFSEGIRFEFPESSDPAADLAPGETVLVVKDREAFAARYAADGFAIAGEYSGNLDNAGERIVLSDVLGNTLLDFTYSDAWQPQSDGAGSSLEIIDAGGEPASWSLPASWRAGASLGTPGFHDPGGPGGLQLPGDLNQDASVDIADAVAMLLHLYVRPAALPCGASIEDDGNRALVDVDASGAVSITDVVFILRYLFRMGPAPALGGRCSRIVGCPDTCGG